MLKTEFSLITTRVINVEHNPPTYVIRTRRDIVFLDVLTPDIFIELNFRVWKQKSIVHYKLLKI